MVDVIIIGGGPAGLSAALVLGRCGRKVIVVDEGKQRNRFSDVMGGYLTRDGISPAEFLKLARAEARRHGVQLIKGVVTKAAREKSGSFRAVLAGGRGGGALRARKMLLATGVRDVLPRIEGVSEAYGISVHHCPYCDAWRHRGRVLAAYGRGRKGWGLALALRTWSPRVVACIDGGRLTEEEKRLAARNGIEVRGAKVVRIESVKGKIKRVHFARGEALRCDALFFNTGQYQRSDLPRVMGCQFKPDGGVRTSKRQATGVPGLYLAGDAAKDVQFVIVAAAEGATAAVAMNREMQDEDRGVRLGGVKAKVPEEGTASARRRRKQPH